MSLGAGIAEFFGDGLAVPVSPMALPQGVQLPAVTYRVISDNPVITHSDAQDHPAYTGQQYSFTRVQFDCVAETYDAAEALRDELVFLASGFKGLWGDVEVDSVRPELRLDDWDPDVALYRVIQDLIVSHRMTPQS